MYVLLPFPDDPLAMKAGEALERQLVHRGMDKKLPPWGKVWVRSGKVICGLPTHPIEGFNVPPVLFIDESLDHKRNLFFIGALAFRPLQAVVAVLRHIQNLIVLAQAHHGFWLSDRPPPRLHLRELTNFKARLKTAWKYVPRRDIELLFRTFVPSIRDTAGLKLVAPVEMEQLNRTLRNSFPGQSESQLQQVSIQLGAMMLHGMLTDAKLSVSSIELISDHDHTPVQLGTRKRQATLHFLDGLMAAQSLAPTKSELTWDREARYSSKFPATFTMDALTGEGFSLRPLVEAVGLQFTDAYLGLWRIVNSDRKPFMGISFEDLGVQTVANMTWASASSAQ